jgi:hypothetical protein
VARERVVSGYTICHGLTLRQVGAPVVSCGLGCHDWGNVGSGKIGRDVREAWEMDVFCEQCAFKGKYEQAIWDRLKLTSGVDTKRCCESAERGCDILSGRLVGLRLSRSRDSLPAYK